MDSKIIQCTCNRCKKLCKVSTQESLIPGRDLIQIECTSIDCKNWMLTRYTRDEDFGNFYQVKG